MAINFPEGTQDLPCKVVHYETYVNSTRQTSINTSSGNYRALLSGTFNKKLSNSNILVIGYSQGFNNYSGAVQFRCVVGNVNTEYGGGYQYTADGYLKAYHCQAIITNNTQTGNITVSYGYRSQIGGGEAPFTVQNPTGSDDTRLSATGTVMHVIELAP